jgi:hypothetical protein
MIWLLVGYMFLEIHRPYEIWMWMARIYVERWYMIAVIGYWLLRRPSLPRANRLHWRFGLFIAVMLASWFASPYEKTGDPAVEGYLKHAVFYFMLVATIRTQQDLRKIVWGYLGVMTLWMVHSLREYYFFGNRTWAQGLLRLVPVGISYDFNDFAALMICSLPFAWILWREATGRRQQALVCAYMALVSYCVVLTGSRMGFGGLALVGLMGCLASPKRWRLLAIYPVVLIIAWTVLPEGNRDRYTTLIDPDYKSVYGASAMGDYRYGAMERGYVMCEQRPLLGLGPLSFMAVRYNGLMAHNLYAQVLGELGIAGAVAFAAIVLGFRANFFEARRIRRAMDNPEGMFAWHTVAAATATLVVLLIMSWGFNFLFSYVWLWFGGFQIVALQCLKDSAASEPVYDEQDDPSWEDAEEPWS